jgi:membrane-associated phospholipid phosphatase
MSKTYKLRKAGLRLSEAEARVTRAAAPRAGSGIAKVVATVGKAGDQPELRTLSGIVIALGLLRSDRRMLRAGIRMTLAHEVATLAKDLVKVRVDRTRPHSAKSRREQAVKPGNHTAKVKTSFPSGHSAGSIAVARAFGREYPELEAPALAAAALVGGLQVPRLAHYPTDVAAGMVVGAVSEALSDLVFVGADDEV